MPALGVRQFGVLEYQPVWQQMQTFTADRNERTQDELWLLQHKPVYTLGMNGKPGHIISAGDIPVICTDRGGQVTYHGPGQMMAYVLLDLRRADIGIRKLVEILEQSVIDWLATCSVNARARRDAPGVYVDGAKVAALGLRIKRGCSYHGLSLNVDVDLEPFSRINPCGFEGLAVTRSLDLGIQAGVEDVYSAWSEHFADILGYTLQRK